MTPLVSCIMPTANRRAFIPRAIELFRRQTYPNKQLVIVEDGGESCRDLIPTDFDGSTDGTGTGLAVAYLYLDDTRRSIGEKRNIACNLSRGEIVAHWDDDDWYSSRRLAVQVDAMQREDAQMCGIDRLVFYTSDGAKAWLYKSRRVPWFAGSALMYRRALVERCGGFTDVSNGEDTAFIDEVVNRKQRIAVVSDPSLMVGMLHVGNTVKKHPDTYQWTAFSTDTVREWFAAEEVPNGRA